MPTHSPFRQELRALLLLLGPILVSQLSQAGFGFVDTVMSGHVSPLDLAAVALGASIWLPIMLALIGILMATTPLVASAVGKRDFAGIPSIIHQALWVALFLALFGVFLLHNITPIFDWLDTPLHLRDITHRYLRAISWGLPAVCFYRVLSSYCEGLARPMPMMIFSLAGLLLNIPINYIFIHGLFGLPKLGGVGCGVASAIVMWAMAFALLIYVLKAPVFEQSRPFQQKSHPDKNTIFSFLKLGLPIGIAMFFEVSVFALIAILISPLGEIKVAGHQIALSISSLLFMFPLSLAFCMTIRTGHAYGREDINAIRLTRKVGLITMTLFASLSALFVALTRNQLVFIYTTDIPVSHLAAQLLFFVAVYQIVDALQVGAAGSLRGMHDTKGPMIITMLAYWGIALPLGYTLGMTTFTGEQYGPHGFWIGLTLGLTVSSLLLNIRLARQIRKVETVFIAKKA